VPEAADLPFAFLRDMLAQSDTRMSDEAGSSLPTDAATEAAKTAMLDATVNILAGLRQLLQAAEDMVRLRRDRVASTSPEAPQSPTDAPHGRERLDLTY
jgi:hypothetical protein